MADGDPIRFVSEELGTNVGFETFTTGLADDWTKVDEGTASTPASDDANERSGTYCQKITFNSSDDTSLYQEYTLPGRTDSYARNKGTEFVFSVWVKGTSPYANCWLKITEYDSLGNAGSSGVSSEAYLTTSYFQQILSYAIQDTDCAKIRAEIVFAPQDPAVAYIDDASIKMDYTVDVNPTGQKGLGFKHSIPEAKDSGLNNTLVWQRNVSTAEKIRSGKLIFGQCPPDQKNALLSLWRLGTDILFYPYSPDLPEYLTIHLYDPDFYPLTHSWGLYNFTILFDEI